MSGFENDDLKLFLQKNAPMAPAAPRDEFQKILELAQGRKEGFISSRLRGLMAGAGAFAVAVIAAVFISQTPTVGPMLEDDLPSEMSEVADVFTFSEQTEAIEIGEDYLDLLAENDL